ncbi:MAG: UDP-N-acetylmuramate--L-alanine ligase [Salinisphaera sp.]|nr:UDP-N-acetylmuramate--L-alanine ligase [Salinisphaera sp.]
MNGMAEHFAPLAQRPMRRVRRVHFVGIGGVGMAGIAEVLINLGYAVSGSDAKAGTATQRLQRLGADVRVGHKARQVTGADVVVVSSAIAEDNPEVAHAREHLIPVVPRAEMLAELMRFRYGIAVAGTHGKTTTTSLVAALLHQGGLDPTFIVGGKVLGTDSNARLGTGPYLVAEADESDASFLFLTPMLAVVTNIDADHLDAYGGDFQRQINTYLEFIHHLPFYGLAVLCVDDPVVREIVPRVGRPMLSYAIDREADLCARNLHHEGASVHFDLHAGDSDAGWPVHLSLPGRHNVYNALAAAAVARELGVEMPAIQAALSEFAGIARRCQVLGEIDVGGKRCLLVDDYAHHPSELAGILAAARAAWPQRRLLVVFQPHRYSRTRDLFEDFCRVLAGLDVLLLCEVYAAGEPAIANADGRALARGVRIRGGVDPVFVEDLGEIAGILVGVAQDGDLVLTLGAGDIGQMAAGLAANQRWGGGS